MRANRTRLLIGVTLALALPPLSACNAGRSNTFGRGDGGRVDAGSVLGDVGMIIDSCDPTLDADGDGIADGREGMGDADGDGTPN